ncbi:MAG: GIY-YIG nuclease family protein [Candidatus Methanomethylophilaceae archaeon]|nr:GIY-YIG nuclease family protein [Thermoplasmata archaeon]MBQ3685724.1 GIY-YIG nuclease family protein [Candidatus Methanomethylophilaceae archaeon]
MIRKGTYVLAVTLGSPADIRVGALGILHFDPGLYIYVGSAMGGLDQRLSRHLRRDKPLRWHIDYLTSAADSAEAFESYPDFIPECELARMAEASGMVPAAKGFGCSDCSCPTHLFRATAGQLAALVSSAGMARFR